MAATPPALATDSHMRRSERILWSLALAVVIASRLLLIPGGVWEQDEALFASSAFDTDLAQHRPHPPGFPLWIAAAKLGLWTLGDPVLGLQVLSAAASVVTVLLLAGMWGAALGSARLGQASALLYAFLPGVWFHAPRAFSTTPALCLAVAACFCWCRRSRSGLFWGAALLGASLLTRPILVPVLAVVAAAALTLRSEPLRRWFAAGLTVSAVVAAGFVPLIIDSGGLAPFLAAVSEHGSGHAGALHLGSWRVEDWGMVKALGGLPAAAAAGALAAVGWWRLRRRRPGLAWWWLAVAVTTVGFFLLAHNRTYPRYTLPVLALLVGPVAGGVATLTGSVQVAARLVLGAAAVSAAFTAPALVAQAGCQPPPLSALAAAHANAGARSVVVDGALSPFSDLLTLARRGRLPTYWRPLIAEGRVPLTVLEGPWVYVQNDGSLAAWVPPPWPEPQRFSCESLRLRSLSQQRYLSCASSRGGGIVLDPVYPEMLPDGGVEIGERLTLLLEPAPRRSWLGVVLEVQGEAVNLQFAGERVGAWRGSPRPGIHTSYRAIDAGGSRQASRPLVIHLSRSGTSTGRALLRRVWIDDPSGPHSPHEITAEQQAGGMNGLINGSGFYDPEHFGDSGQGGRWTGAEAWLSLPAGRGRLTVSLCAPRPRPAEVKLSCPQAGLAASLEVGPEWQDVAIPLPAGDGRVRLLLTVSNPFVPAEAIAGSEDRRTLGVVLGPIRFERE